MRRGVALMAAAVLASACGDAGTGPGPVTESLSVEVVSGDGQRGLAGEPLPEVIRVRVVDAHGLPSAGATVRTVVTVGSGSVGAGSTLSDRAGEATIRWRLGPPAAREQRLRITVDGEGPGSEVVVGATALGPEEADVVVVHGALGPLVGFALLRDDERDVVVIQDRRTADTLFLVQPQDQPGSDVFVLATANRPERATGAWTPGVDTLHVTLRPPLAVDLVFRVRVGDFAAQQQAIESQLSHMRDVWRDGHMGVVVGTVTIRDEIQEGVDVPVTSTGLCGNPAPTDAIEISYVTSIDGGTYDGWGCTVGLVFMSLHSPAYPYLLAHELGHTFTLPHTISGLMYGPNPGTRIWDGEVFRAHFHAFSTLNTLFDGQPGAHRRTCGSGSPCLAADYDLGQNLVAQAALVAGAPGLHHGLRPGGRPLDGVEEQFVRPPRLTPELRPEPEEHHVP